uniref:Uncharacterized protein LOC114338084 isoform X2 n=1 Tax=Diabrotica virgifera virgifera TaxID=50390 RepID=A0A6P7GH61_DIAVI
MKHLLIFIVCLISTQLITCLPTSSNDGQHDIIEGNCANPDPEKIVYRDHVEKMAIPFIVRDNTNEWRGDANIFCVMVISEQDESKGSTARITEGGVDHHFITIELESGRGNALDYNIKIYAE